MKRIFLLFCALALILSLAACAKAEAPAAEAASPTPAPTEAPSPTPAPTDTPQPEETPLPPPTLSPGAAESSRLSASFDAAEDGGLLSAIAKGETVAYLPELLPEELSSGYIAGFLRDGGTLYVAVKDGYRSLEPTRLYRIPEGGEAELLSDSVSPAARFCLAGDSLFFLSYEDENLWRYDLVTGESAAALPDRASLLAAADGYIYYTKADGLYRNDSTMAAEVKIGGTGVLSLAAEGETLCVLAASEDGSSAAVGWLDRNGVVSAMTPLPEPTDTLLYRDGLAYVPLRGEGCVLVLSPDGTEAERLPLTVTGPYYVLWYADGDALYYETLLADEEEPSVPLVRLPLDGGESTVVARLGG